MKQTHKKINNEFTIEGQVVKMTILNKKGKELVAIFDLEDLEKVQAQGNWFAEWHKDYNSYLVQSISTNAENKKAKPQKISLHHFLLNQPSYTSIIHISEDTVDNRKQNLKLYDPKEKNEIEVLDNGVVSITLKNKLGKVEAKALISESDLELVMQDQYTWVILKRGNGQRQAVANTPEGRVYLNQLIMQPSELEKVYHINKNQLDNRRQNLELHEVETEEVTE